MTKEIPSIADLIAHTKEYIFPKGHYGDQCSTLLNMFEDTYLEQTRARLGMRNPHLFPMTICYLERIVSALAVAYDTPPRFTLVLDGKELDTNSDEYQKYQEVLEDSQYFASWHRINQYRELFGTVGVRTYYDLLHGALKLEVVMPHKIFRKPSDADPSNISADECFALQKRTDRFEYWVRMSDLTDERQIWKMTIVDEGNHVLERPYEYNDDVAPYRRLPMQLIHNEAMVISRPMVPIRESRISYQENINQVFSNLFEIMDAQTHSQLILKHTDRNNKTTTQVKEVGPKKGINVSPGTEIETIDFNPKIQECIETTMKIGAAFEESEKLPPGFFASNNNKIYSSTVEHLLHLLPLKERRNQTMPLIKREQRIQHLINVDVYNAHQSRDVLNPDTVLKIISAGKYETVIEPKTRLEIFKEERSLGLVSDTQYLKESRGLTEAEAEAEYMRIQMQLQRETKIRSDAEEFRRSLMPEIIEVPASILPGEQELSENLPQLEDSSGQN